MPDRDEASWRASRWKRFQAAFIGTLLPPVIEVLARTWRWQVEGREHLDAVTASGQPPILALWHGRILPGTVYFRDRGIVVITSENFDGEWIARVIGRFGYGTARGSSSRGGVRALVQLRRDLAAGRPAAFTVDGPRGPRHRVQPGCIWLAKSTGSPILPFHIESRSCWTLRSWDRTQIPRPFTPVIVCIGAPFFVPPDSDDAAIELRRLALEQELQSLGTRARVLTGRPPETGA
jgi:lysophospholipid acyltransferase (LPLAT)-like uncharacterized protein